MCASKGGVLPGSVLPGGASRGVCFHGGVLPGGVLPGGCLPRCVCVSQHALGRHPPVNRMTDRQG